MAKDFYRAGMIKRCPLCGGAAKLSPMPGAASWWRVTCEAYDCGCKTWAMQEAEHAVAAWNRRVNGTE